MTRVVIVGAGISGLALAYRLHQLLPTADLTILEERDRPGGTMWTERRDGFQVEIGANGFLDNKTSTLALCTDVGLGADLTPASEAAGRNRYLLLEGRLQPLPRTLGAFLRSPLLSWRGKLAALSERFCPRRREVGDESVQSFVQRRAGREAADTLADAFVTGIHAGDPALLSMPAAFPRLVELETKHGSVLKGMAATARRRRQEAAAHGQRYRPIGQMWSFRQGLRLLVETLSARLPQPPLLGVAVRTLERRTSTRGRPTWVVRSDTQQWEPDVVVLTCPAYTQASLLKGLDAPLAEHVNEIAYNRVAVVALGYRATDIPMSVDGFGFIAPQRTRRDLLGVQWCSSIYPERAPPELVLLRAMCGGWNRPDVLDWDDARLVGAVRKEIQAAMGIIAQPVFDYLVRWDRAIPQYHLGHLDRVTWIEKRCAAHPGLFLGGNAYRGIAVNDCTEQAERLARQVQDYLAVMGGTRT
jgi:oxygen-dependent protoporphyrinogen oxidase